MRRPISRQGRKLGSLSHRPPVENQAPAQPRAFHLGLFTCLALSLSSPACEGGDKWDLTFGAQHTQLGNFGSQLRRSISSSKLSASAEYLDDWGVALASSSTEVLFHGNVAPIDQEAHYFGAHKHLTPDGLEGRLTLRLDTYSIDNNDPTGGTSGGRVLAPQVAYRSFDRSLALALGYAHSEYDGGLQLQQWTPSVGFPLRAGQDWLHLRGYWVQSDDAGRTQGMDSTSALDCAYTLFFEPGAAHTVDTLYFNALLGRRVFGVDPDAQAVYNLSDIQEGALSAGLGWQVSEQVSLSLLAGVGSFRNADLNDEYTSRFLHLRFSTRR